VGFFPQCRGVWAAKQLQFCCCSRCLKFADTVCDYHNAACAAHVAVALVLLLLSMWMMIILISCATCCCRAALLFFSFRDFPLPFQMGISALQWHLNCSAGRPSTLLPRCCPLKLPLVTVRKLQQQQQQQLQQQLLE